MYCRWTNDPTRKGRPRRSSDPPTRGRPVTAPATAPPPATMMRLTTRHTTTTAHAWAAHPPETRVSPTRIPSAPGPGASAVTETPPEVTP